MKKLYFKDKNANMRLLDYPADTEQQAIAGIYDFCRQHKFEPFYVRTWKKNEKWWYDVGSYTEFFVWADENDIKSEELV